MSGQDWVPEDAVRRGLRCHEIVLFCGAGISMDAPATLPDWNSFRDETIRAVASVDGALSDLVPVLIDREPMAAGRRGLAPEVIASQTLAVCPDYFDCLSALDHDDWNRNHALIAHSVKAGLVRQIITTNFDQLIEKALTSLGVAFHVYRTDEDFAQWTAAGPRAAVEVFKLHGCLSDPDSIVATVEQEAVGVSPAKAGVLRQIWPGQIGLFWGYSGADLKAAHDYLRLAECAEHLRAVIWNLYSTPDWREEPLPELRQLLDSLAGKGHIVYCDIASILAGMLGVSGQDLGVRTGEDSAGIKARRNAELGAAIRAWASASLRPEQALEIFGELLERIDEPGAALACYERLGSLLVNETGEAVRVLEAHAGTRQALLLCALGLTDEAEWVRAKTREAAVAVGSVDSLITLAMVHARLLAERDGFLASLQPRAFAHRVARWASPAGVRAQLELSLDTAREFFRQGLVEESLAALDDLDSQAQEGGFLEIRSRVLALRSQVHRAWNELAEALRCAQEAEKITVSLGLERDTRLLRYQRILLEARLEQTTSVAAEDLTDALRWASSGGSGRTEAEVYLDAIEILETRPQETAADLARMAAWALKAGERNIYVRAMWHTAWIHQDLGDSDAELAAIDSVLPDLHLLAFDGYAGRLVERYALLKQAQGAEPAAVLGYLDTAISVRRETRSHSPTAEDEAARIRSLLGLGGWSGTYVEFLDDWLNGTPLRNLVIEFLGLEFEEMDSGVTVNYLAQAMESRYGLAGSRSRSLVRSSMLAEGIRRDGDPSTSLAIALQSLSAAIRLGDRQLAAMFHNQAGLCLFDLGRMPAALDHFTHAVGRAESVSDDRRLHHYFHNMAVVYRELGRHDAAVACLRKELDVARRRQNFTVYQQACTLMGDSLKELRRMPEAVEFFDQTQYCAWILNDADRMVKAARQLGKAYHQLGEYEFSIAHRAQAAEICEARGDMSAAADALLLVAFAYDDKLGRGWDAIPYYRYAITHTSDDDPLDPQVFGLLAQCEQDLPEVASWLHSLIAGHVTSPQEADGLAVPLALHLGFNLWHYELRSWAAWTERHLPPVVIGHALLTLGKTARARRQWQQATDMFELAIQLAKGPPVFELMDQVHDEAHIELVDTKRMSGQS
ncbi:tetratricopeptide (TPR) repeat protein [Allocatelliglobosispora scoriae]|uniref:Tetratricopeptide (TPR) repeat protein n=1 Tax=Allocatelliglobosispora scoriae TaxID=643052 RepID=A0A841BHN6_9ACTN|nr:tetratricopeptide repeat protein [Allocatelliglobosispora scoriae]MBB5866686.1 tetratricopeptide (TPR) repeat protein [Allocatelliglobosispora scoriae]